MMWACIALLVAVSVVGGYLASRDSWPPDPPRPEHLPPAGEILRPSRLGRCHSCVRWQGGAGDKMAYCGHTRKMEEREDSCSRHVPSVPSSGDARGRA